MSSWFPELRGAFAACRAAAIAAAIAALASLMAAPALADEWAMDSSISSKATYNDNYNLRSSNVEAATNLTLTPSLTLSSRTETRDINVNLAVTANRYLEHPENNALDHRFGINLKWSTELNQWTLTLSSTRDSTLNSELQQTGLVLARRQRSLNSFSAGWQRSLSERIAASADYHLSKASYEPAPGLVDYSDQAFSLGLHRVMSEQLTLGAGLSRREFRTATGDQESSVNSVSLNAQYRLSERMTAGFSVGRDRTNTRVRANALVCNDLLIFCLIGFTPFTVETFDITSAAHSTSYNANLGYEFETGSLSSNLSRSLTASGAGTLLRSDLASINWRRSYSDTLEFSVDASVVRSSVLANLSSQSRYTSLGSSLRWSLDQRLTLGAGYTWLTQATSGQRGARGDVFFISLEYGFLPISRGW